MTLMTTGQAAQTGFNNALTLGRAARVDHHVATDHRSSQPERVRLAHLARTPVVLHGLPLS
ncbi:hypothetical protein N7448_000476 [Penicillium atrosanguineum]|uniref:Uncharacterized protein n=1 Tax=Penicillium atrosanguineum TaxID=1132637 RepID=A0A9W9HIB6_9EURO|nr:uncharacterized protein N7443_003874 [Penicillium atrosanguineum]KAJ5134504.1 hypothetical protein N7526_005869 [Penicillium atrosanguineum]KAJ5148898.1 hypothetical protein N7448_000476 [Penicillium atrosanguineum]KAJ5304214.1 hypothetical protein N7443_003874 [Penicillium atrosanguineum]KAJ5323689.1 hypothetical protein N7476_002289 [Penicillium atrosanguineum]